MRTNVLVSLAAFGAVLTGVGAAPALPDYVSAGLRGLGVSSRCKTWEVRREWRSFSKAEKAAYIAAVN
ncbi:hypothetical protein FRC06_004682, partial [Ceratobasidium sp. 370]